MKPPRFLRTPCRAIFPPRSEWRALARPVAASVAAGLLLRLPFPPVEWPLVAWFGLAPFLAALRGRTARQGAWLGFFFGLAFFYPNLTWLNTLSSFNPLAPLGIAALAAACALFPMVFGLAAAAGRPVAGRLGFLYIPALWTALEYVRSLGELGFPWVYLGHSQATRLTVIQIAEVTGVYGVSFVIALANTVLADAWAAWRQRPARRQGLAAESMTAALLLLAVIGWGLVRLAHFSESGAKRPGLRVALVQPGVPQSEKLASYTSPSAATRDRLQRKAIDAVDAELGLIAHGAAEGSPPDICVLPESVIAHPAFNLMPELEAAAEGWAERIDAPVLFGAGRFIPPPGARPEEQRFYALADVYNTAYLARPGSGLDPDYYDKMHLVPFGEYASYFSVIPGFTDYVLGIGEFAVGQVPRVFTIPSRPHNEPVRFGVVICFESCFPYLFRKYIGKGVGWMAVITNDAWYQTSSGARRHQIQSIFRAVETRRSVARVANTGISCIVSPAGREIVRLALREGETKHIVGNLPLPETDEAACRTFYMTPAGETFSWLCLAFSLGVAIRTIRAYRRKLRVSAEPRTAAAPRPAKRPTRHRR